jgi:hypothetical protein
MSAYVLPAFICPSDTGPNISTTTALDATDLWAGKAADALQLDIGVHGQNERPQRPVKRELCGFSSELLEASP